jgi:hypothetical protein
LNPDVDQTVGGIDCGLAGLFALSFRHGRWRLSEEPKPGERQQNRMSGLHRRFPDSDARDYPIRRIGYMRCRQAKVHCRDCRLLK